MGCPDVVAEPQARVRQRDLGGCQQLRHAPREHARVGGVGALARQRAPMQARSLQRRRDEHVVVVAGADHDLAALGRGPDRGQHRRGQLQHLLGAPLAQLEQVAEHHHAVGAGERAGQPLGGLGATGHVGVRDGAQVQIGDHGGGHGAHILTGRVAVLPPQPVHRRLPDLLEGHRPRGRARVHAAAVARRQRAQGPAEAGAGVTRPERGQPRVRGRRRRSGTWSGWSGCPVGFGWPSGRVRTLRRRAPVLAAADLVRLAEASAQAVGAADGQALAAAAATEPGDPAPGPAVSKGRTGDFKEELRVEALRRRPRARGPLGAAPGPGLAAPGGAADVAGQALCRGDRRRRSVPGWWPGTQQGA